MDGQTIVGNADSSFKPILDELRLLAQIEIERRLRQPEPGFIREIQDVKKNRIELIFPSKVNGREQSILKSSGFQWDPDLGIWHRDLSNGGKAAAKDALEKIKDNKKAA